MRSLLVRRVLAYLIDCALLFIVLAVAGAVAQEVLGVAPATPRAIYATLLLNFSLPVWTYFAWSDHSARGATLGKRILELHARMTDGTRIGMARAFERTAIKMIPWELTHASAFLLAPALGVFGALSWVGIGLAYALLIAYLVVAWRTSGRRSLHDVVAGTIVDRASA
jgi:uncharacterized RDD family membrane protein YckC